MSGYPALKVIYFPARACAKRGSVSLSVCDNVCQSVCQSSKFWADHDNEGSKHFSTSLNQWK